MRLIVYAGTSASGKDSAGDYTLEMYPAAKRTLSDILRKQAGPGASNAALRETGNLLRAQHGPHILARLAYEDLLSTGKPIGVITSVRHPAEADFLLSVGGTFAWFDAPVQTRYERYVSRATPGRPPMTFEEFIKEEHLQYFGDGTGYSLQQVHLRIPRGNRIWNGYAAKEKFLLRVRHFLKYTARLPERNSY